MPPASFNLKQRLAALSLAPSSPSSPGFNQSKNGDAFDYLRSPTSPNTKRKMFINNVTPNWMKKSQGGTPTYREGYSHGDEEKRMVQEVLAKMIFQAGVDFEVVLNASALPDPQVVSYDLLLSRILSYLDLYVEADYTVVFFAAGSKHAPSWNWVWKAYRSLSRKYRKNLKQLYIVHSSFFSKMLFSLAGAIISPKFFRKLIYTSTLSELARHVPLTQIDIPPAVYQENLKYERKITMPVPSRSNVFGVPLEDLMGYDGEKGGIPRVVKDAIHYLRQSGMQEEGLFRRSPSSSLLRAAQDAYDRGNVVSLEAFADPHLAAVLLKKYLRDLPEPIFPESTYGVVRRCPLPSGSSEYDAAEMAAVRYVRESVLPELVPCAYILFSQVMHILHDVSLRSEYNKMGSSNLAIVITPNLVKSSNPMRDVLMCNVPTPGRGGSTSSVNVQLMNADPSPDLADGKCTLGAVIDLCIRRYYEIFDEVIDRSEAVAPWRTLRTSQIYEGNSEGSGSPREPMYVLGDADEDDYSYDDENNAASQQQPVGRGPWTHQSTTYVPPNSQNGASRRKRSRQSNGGGGSRVIATQSLFNGNASGDGPSSSSPSAGWSGTVRGGHNSKARSVVSVGEIGEGALGTGTLRKGSISVGRGTTRKGSGAAVEAHGVIAEGFFTPPAGAPPVPPRPGSISTSTTTTLVQDNTTSTPVPTVKVEQPQDEEEPRLSVGERRRMFESGR
ncbi:Rho GTPase-activating protein 8 [Psilocybe cubensis]|uniref:Rho GTPase-activating protein 8 n=1 Tax=Psilocybe cubensis TaxID=181762 RepID=A0ACB8GYY8_PSICU|nr:Rho GTPase-activating protein 8 [Psilocybe cubensis]KAH9480705.1 Rho GTPase-activating protein 8 [Psilocybe cubensis]